MNRESAKTELCRLLLLPTLIIVASGASAQVPIDENGYPISAIDAIDGEVLEDRGMEQPALTSAELEQLIGPIALYPDDLLAVVLPASTYPLQIVQAARFLDEFEQDSSLQPDEEWDDSVVALLNYPEVLKQMNEDIDWTWTLGEAVIGQQEDVIGAVESFRDRAYAAGNLKSDEHQTINSDDGIIEIVPVDEEIIYVPYYEPERVLVSQAQPVVHYYERPYPVYYYPYPSGYHFSSGYFWGVTTAFGIGWANDRLRVHHQSYWGHPFYGRNYYGHYYRRPSINIYNSYYVNRSPSYRPNRYRDGDYWRPRSYGGSRPGYYQSRTQSYRDQQVSVRNRSNRRTGSDQVRIASSSVRDMRADTIRFRSREESSGRNENRSGVQDRSRSDLRRDNRSVAGSTTRTRTATVRPDTMRVAADRRAADIDRSSSQRSTVQRSSRRTPSRPEAVTRNAVERRQAVQRTDTSRSPSHASRPAETRTRQNTSASSNTAANRSSKGESRRESSSGNRSRNDRRTQRR